MLSTIGCAALNCCRMPPGLYRHVRMEAAAVKHARKGPSKNMSEWMLWWPKFATGAEGVHVPIIDIAGADEG